jgi:hypothetical protein
MAAVASSQLTGRTYLTAPINQYVNELAVGAADTGTCTNIATPCLTIQYALNVLQSQYDLAGQPATINAACQGSSVPSFTHGVLAYGALLGQQTPNQVVVLGDVSNPSNCWMKLASGNCLAMSYNAMLTWAGIKCDTYATGGSDEMSIADGATLLLGRAGDAKSVTWGDAINPANHMSIAGGRVYLQAPDSMELTPPITLTISATSPVSNFVNVNSCAGVIENLGVWGPGTTTAMPAQVVVVGCTGNVLQLNAYTTRTLNVGENIYISRGGNAHAAISQHGKLAYYNNCGSPAFDGTITGDPYFYEGTWRLYDIGEADLGIQWSGSAHGLKYYVQDSSVLNTCGQAVAGSYGGIYVAGNVH